MTWVEEFPGNFVWSNATLVTKGMAPYGAVALGEIDEVCERLRARHGTPEADDRVVPVASAHTLYEALASPRKHLKILTAADGSTYHAWADNRQVGVDYIADWISSTL